VQLDQAGLHEVLGRVPVPGEQHGHAQMALAALADVSRETLVG
jgi:hypothetical protein